MYIYTCTKCWCESKFRKKLTQNDKTTCSVCKAKNSFVFDREES
jgi:predicted nucleic acid-binding Zn ribbon protein